MGDQNALDQALQITGDSVGVDTEFVRETTFWPVPGLIQIGNAQSVALIDPLADMEWSGFSEWMKNPDQTKVMHAGFEDLELFARHFDVHPTPYFDTQIAQACLGGPISMGLDALVQLHGFPGLDKSKSRNDWTIRPLARDLLDYAAQDVVHLPEIASQQRERLIELDRLSWLVEEQQAAIARIRAHLSGELDPMGRMKGLHYLDGRGLTTVRALVHWREQVARSTNTARSRVARDEFLLALGAAVDWPKHPMKLEGARSSFKHYADAMRRVFEEAQGFPAEEALPAPKRPTSAQKNAQKALKADIVKVAETHGLVPEFLAKRKDIERWALGRSAPSGWRAALLERIL